MTEPQPIVWQLLGLKGERSPTPQDILKIGSETVTAETVEKRIQERAAEIMSRLPGPQFIPLMIPIRQILQQAGEELLADEPESSPAPASPESQTPAPEPQPVKPPKPKPKPLDPSGLLERIPRGKISQLLTTYDNEMTRFLTHHQKRRLIDDMRRQSAETTPAAASEAMNAFWEERREAGRTARPNFQNTSPPPGAYGRTLPQAAVPNPGELASLARRLGCSPDALTAQYQKWNQQPHVIHAPKEASQKTSQDAPNPAAGAGGKKVLVLSAVLLAIILLAGLGVFIGFRLYSTDTPEDAPNPSPTNVSPAAAPDDNTPPASSPSGNTTPEPPNATDSE